MRVRSAVVEGERCFSRPGRDSSSIGGKRPSARGTSLGVLSTGGALAAGQVTTGLALLVLARRASPTSFGLFAVLYGASLAVATLLDFGSSQRQVRELSRGYGRRQFRGWLVQRSAFQAPAGVVFAVVCVAVLRGRLPVVAVLGLSMQAITFPLSNGALSAVRALRSPALAAWMVAAGNIVLLGTTIAAPDRYLVAASGAAAATSWLVTTVAALWATRSLVGCDYGGLGRNPWAGTAGFGIFAVAVALGGLDILIVGAVGGAVEAGQLAAVSRWIQPIILIAAAYGTHIFPSLAAADSDQAAVRSLRGALPAIGLAVIAAGLVVAGAPWLIHNLLGSEYDGSASLLRLLAIGCLPIVLSQPLATVLQARHQEKFVAKTSTAGLLLVLLLIALLVRRFGAAAVPVSGFVGSAVLCGVWLHRVRSIFRKPTVFPQEKVPAAHLGW